MALTLERKIVVGFSVAVVGVALISATAWINATRVGETFRWVDHTHETLSQLEQILVDALNIETGMRGFALTGDESYLAPYEEGSARVRKSLSAVRELTRDNPAQQRRIAALDPLVLEEIALMQTRNASRRARGPDVAAADIAVGKGRDLMDRIRRLVGEMESEERRLLDERSARSQAAARTTIAIVGVAGLLSAFCVGAASWVGQRGFRAHHAAQRALRAANEQLEERVKTRAHELTLANAALVREVVERRQAEAVVREREQELTLITDNIPGIVSRVDRQLRYVFASASCERWFERKRADILGHTMAELIGPEAFQRAEPFVARALAGERATFEIQLPVRKTELLDLLVTFVPDFDAAGIVQGFFVVGMDIAERKLAEEALRRSEHRFRALIEHSADAISLIDAQNNILYLSPSVAAVEGFTAAELAGRNGLENTHPDDLPFIHETVQKLVAQPGQPIPVLWRRRHKQGHWIWLEGVATNLLHDPSVNGIVTNYRDVTARKQAEAAVRESEQRFRTLTENLPDLVSRFDRDFRLIYLNPAREALTGHRLADSVGKRMSELGSSIENASHVENAMARVIATRQTERIEVVYATSTGRTTWETTLVAEPAEDGSVASVLILSHDVTERHRAEESIRQLNANLEERVRARTAQIETVNRELEAFSYSVSHDLRAPLRHIDGFAGLLTKRAASVLDDQNKRYLTVISEAARQMGRLIDDLLSFSRMGRAPLNAVELDHAALVADVIKQGHYDEAVPPVTWAIALPSPVFADPALLRQVWSNLIDNAVKYSGKNPQPSIEIGQLPAGPSGEITCFIRDNGVGFDMKYVGKLFGVFQRLHGLDEFPGTGVGLANVHRIITRHSGRVWAESRVGEGATFHFSLPGASQITDASD